MNNKTNIIIDDKIMPFFPKKVYLDSKDFLKDSINEIKIFIGEGTDYTDIKFIDFEKR